ncbi:MAG: hypothetical protein BWZ07_00479 [Alphaproteobacteria bacterium ADurb.BinA280]|nr:MAG: hypothetical protein BWZ07_00479 [Alphaproteobacteria bacterium ADurb.BinA280]
MGKPFGIREFVRLFLENLDEQIADNLALGFRIGDPLQGTEITLGGIDANDLDAHVLGEHRHDLIAFLPAQQAGIDEDAGQLRADGLVQQCGNHRGIHAAGQSQDDLLLTDLRAYASDLVVDNVAGGPQGSAATDVHHKATQQCAALTCVGDFGVELHAIPAALIIREGGDGNTVGDGGHGEAAGNHGNVVTVTHPDIQMRHHAVVVAQAMQQAIFGDHRDLGVAEFALIRRFGVTTQLFRHGLHAIADTEQWHACVKYRLRRGRCIWLRR